MVRGHAQQSIGLKTHSIKMYTTEVEERLKRHVFGDEDGKSVELDERFAGRVAQEFEVQAGGDRNLAVSR